MRQSLLVLGGTGFIGRSFVEAALSVGRYRLTLLNRGLTNCDLFPEVPRLICDRNDAQACAAALQHTEWDHIVDFSAYRHQHIEHVIANCRTRRYTLLSSSAVELSWPEDEFFQMAQDKLWCEHILSQAYAKPLIFRAGFVVGAGDPSGRFERRGGIWYWRGTERAVKPVVEVGLLVRLMLQLISSSSSGIVRAGYDCPRLMPPPPSAAAYAGVQSTRHSMASGLPKIVAVVMSSGDEEHIREVLESVVESVDSILLVDTGIADHTCEIAAEYAAKLQLRRLAWQDDMAAARNQALAFAAELGAQWVLMLSGNERLLWSDPKQSVEDLRRYLAEYPDVQTWLIASADGAYAKEKLIRVAAKPVWVGRAHAALLVDPAARGLLPNVRVAKRVPSVAALQAKLASNLRLLRGDLRQDPDNARAWYYLGQTLANLGEFEGAISALERCIQLRETQEMAAWASFLCAKCYTELGLLDEAIECCAGGLAIDAGSPELAWMAAYCHYQNSQHRQAVAWARMAIALGMVEGIGESIPRMGFRDLTGWYEGPFDILRHAYAALGDTAARESADELYRQAQQRRHNLPR